MKQMTIAVFCMAARMAAGATAPVVALPDKPSAAEKS